MRDRTCVWDGCDKPWTSRGLCSNHYGKALRKGTLDSFERPGKAMLSDVDLDAGTVTCSKHGPESRIRVRVRPSGKSTISCRTCDRGERGRRGETPRKKKPKRARSGYSRVWNQYGVSDDEIRLRLEAQGGLCLLCQELMEVPMIDHCHKSGEVRGLLCRLCNSGLGMFRDNPDALMRASKYVKRYLRAAA